MVEQIFSRESKEFGDKIFSLKNEGKFCDGVLIVNGQRVSVHTLVLAASSEFFEDAFLNLKTTEREVIFTDIDVEIFKLLIEYCYTGTIKINEKNAMEIFKMANILSMSSIMKNSSVILEKMLNNQNCLSMWKFAVSENAEILKTIVSKFIGQNFDNIWHQQEFLTLEYSEVKELLSLNFIMTSEMTIYEAVKKWVNHDKIFRKNDLVSLLNHIKLECLPRKFLMAESQSMCNLNARCFSKFIEALQLEEENDSKNCKKDDMREKIVNTLITAGGSSADNYKEIQVFDTKKQEWFQIKYNDCIKGEFSAIFLPEYEKLMIIGGLISGNAVDTIEYYDLKSGKEESLTPMKYKRWRTSVAKFKESVYVIGGYSNGSVSMVEKWNLKSKIWSDCASITTARHTSGVAILFDEIFVVGGNGVGGDLKSMEAYNPVTNSWRMCSDMNEIRYGLAVAAVGNFLFAVSGTSNGSSNRLTTVEKYDPKINKWSLIQSLGIGKWALGGTSLNGNLVVAGGLTENGTVNTVEMFDEKINKWVQMPVLKTSGQFLNLIEIPMTLAENLLARKNSK